MSLECCEGQSFDEVCERELIRTINNQLHNKVRDLVPDRYRFIVQGKKGVHIPFLNISSGRVRTKRQRLQHFITHAHEQLARLVHVRQLRKRRPRRCRHLSRDLPRIISSKRIFLLYTSI